MRNGDAEGAEDELEHMETVRDKSKRSNGIAYINAVRDLIYDYEWFSVRSKPVISSIKKKIMSIDKRMEILADRVNPITDEKYE